MVKKHLTFWDFHSGIILEMQEKDQKVLMLRHLLKCRHLQCRCKSIAEFTLKDFIYLNVFKLKKNTLQDQLFTIKLLIEDNQFIAALSLMTKIKQLKLGPLK